MHIRVCVCMNELYTDMCGSHSTALQSWFSPETQTEAVGFCCSALFCPLPFRQTWHPAWSFHTSRLVPTSHLSCGCHCWLTEGNYPIRAFMRKCCDETLGKSWFSNLHTVDPLSRGNCTCALNRTHFRNPSWAVQWFFFEFLPPCFLLFKIITENIKRASKGTRNTFLFVFITCVSERQPRRGKILFFSPFLIFESEAVRYHIAFMLSWLPFLEPSVGDKLFTTGVFSCVSHVSN